MRRYVAILILPTLLASILLARCLRRDDPWDDPLIGEIWALDDSRALRVLEMRARPPLRHRLQLVTQQGEVRWTRELPGALIYDVPIRITEGTALVRTFPGDDLLGLGDVPHTLSAYDIDSGELLWAEGELWSDGNARPRLARSAAGPGALYDLDRDGDRVFLSRWAARTGRVVWRRPVFDPTDLLVDGDHLLVWQLASGFVLDAGSGAATWRVESPAGLCLVDGRMFSIAGRSDGGVVTEMLEESGEGERESIEVRIRGLVEPELISCGLRGDALVLVLRERSSRASVIRSYDLASGDQRFSLDLGKGRIAGPSAPSRYAGYSRGELLPRYLPVVSSPIDDVPELHMVDLDRGIRHRSSFTGSGLVRVIRVASSWYLMLELRTTGVFIASFSGDTGELEAGIILGSYESPEPYQLGSSGIWLFGVGLEGNDASRPWAVVAPGTLEVIHQHGKVVVPALRETAEVLGLAPSR